MINKKPCQFVFNLYSLYNKALQLYALSVNGNSLSTLILPRPELISVKLSVWMFEHSPLLTTPEDLTVAAAVVFNGLLFTVLLHSQLHPQMSGDVADIQFYKISYKKI